VSKAAWWLAGVILILALLRWAPMLGGGVLLLVVLFLGLSYVKKHPSQA
jgi:hypothetical protein